MNVRRAMVIAALALAAATGPAAAQWGPPPGQAQPQAAPQEPPCMADFSKLRDDAAKKARAIQEAGKRKANPKEACGLFNAFSAAEAKMIKYAVDNATWCGIPAQIIDGLKQSHVKTTEIRTKICQVAAAPPRPAGPSLSDTLTAPVPDANNIKTGKGTFDTLTGSPLGAR